MTSGSNLKRRGAVLQSTLNTRELVRSLNTTDRRTSNIRKLTKLAEWQDQFARLRRQRDITEGDFAVATWEHYSTELRFDEVERIVQPVIARRLVCCVAIKLQSCASTWEWARQS